MCPLRGRRASSKGIAGSPQSRGPRNVVIEAIAAYADPGPRRRDGDRTVTIRPRRKGTAEGLRDESRQYAGHRVHCGLGRTLNSPTVNAALDRAMDDVREESSTGCKTTWSTSGCGPTLFKQVIRDVGRNLFEGRSSYSRPLTRSSGNSGRA